MYVVKIARARPDELGRSLSQWDCTEIARQLVREGVVSSVSAETVRRILLSHRLKPWRPKMGLWPKVRRDAGFAAAVREICDLHTRPLRADEMTVLQPRPRKSRTLPTDPGRPTRVEHESSRCGAPNLSAAFETRTGKVDGATAPRKRQAAFVAFLEQRDGAIPASVATIHLVPDDLRMPKGGRVRAWLAEHPRFVFHHPPERGSWRNQVERWFSIARRKRPRSADFASKEQLAERLMAFIREWNEIAHRFNRTSKSVAKVMAKTYGKDRLRSSI